MNWSFVVPRGDWVESYPSTNGKIILGIRLAALYVIFCLSFIIVILLFKVEKIPDIVETILSMLGWFIAGVMGLGIAQFVGKRATTTPELVKAESDAKVAQVTAEHTIAVVPAVAPPAPSTAADAVAVANQLASEAQAKAQRQAGTSFEGG